MENNFFHPQNSLPKHSLRGVHFYSLNSPKPWKSNPELPCRGIVLCFCFHPTNFPCNVVVCVLYSRTPSYIELFGDFFHPPVDFLCNGVKMCVLSHRFPICWYVVLFILGQLLILDCCAIFSFILRQSSHRVILYALYPKSFLCDGHWSDDVLFPTTTSMKECSSRFFLRRISHVT